MLLRTDTMNKWCRGRQHPRNHAIPLNFLNLFSCVFSNLRKNDVMNQLSRNVGTNFISDGTSSMLHSTHPSPFGLIHPFPQGAPCVMSSVSPSFLRLLNTHVMLPLSGKSLFRRIRTSYSNFGRYGYLTANLYLSSEDFCIDMLSSHPFLSSAKNISRHCSGVRFISDTKRIVSTPLGAVAISTLTQASFLSTRHSVLPPSSAMLSICCISWSRVTSLLALATDPPALFFLARSIVSLKLSNDVKFSRTSIASADAALPFSSPEPSFSRYPGTASRKATMSKPSPMAATSPSERASSAISTYWLCTVVYSSLFSSSSSNTSQFLSTNSASLALNSGLDRRSQHVCHALSKSVIENGGMHY
mmetsp:Transcript_21052/g.48277  ORF Transcript_21052/g.48277 Transcript_21052/m.48277 type:complete len:360 (+) Transcript_21052:734-1813(+)